MVGVILLRPNTSGNIMCECWSLSDIVSPKIFRYLNFGITSFNFRFIGINKNYLLIIKKFITRVNHNFWLLMNWLFITLNVLAYISFTVTKNFKNKLTSFRFFVYPCAPVPYMVKQAHKLYNASSFHQ